MLVNGEWDRFALANAGEAAASTHVLEHRLWEFISDLSSRELYRQLLKRVRAGSAVRFLLRCDSPNRRRLLEMSIAADEAGAMEFRTRAISEENRRLRAWQGGTDAPAGELVRACGWCNRIMAGEVWVEVEEAVEQSASVRGAASTDDAWNLRRLPGQNEPGVGRWVKRAWCARSRRFRNFDGKSPKFLTSFGAVKFDETARAAFIILARTAL